MNIDAVILPAFQAFNTGIGAILVSIMKVVYAILWPANAPAAGN
ncbi:MAG: hypothetical protein Q3962_04245 [Corynebacterium sp.]|nr:hypothetical protein [Corynebacterium sp.]